MTGVLLHEASLESSPLFFFEKRKEWNDHQSVTSKSMSVTTQAGLTQRMGNPSVLVGGEVEGRGWEWWGRGSGVQGCRGRRGNWRGSEGESEREGKSKRW